MQLPPLFLDRSQGDSLATQLANQLRAAIREGRIAVGTRLPSSRRLSQQLDVARNTVVRAYETLTIEGYVETRSASGVFAAPPRHTHAAAVKPITVPADPAAAARAPMPLPKRMPPTRKPRAPSRGRLNFDLVPGHARASLFPVKTWRRLLQSALSYGGGASLTPYGDPAGLSALRTAIAGHLAFSRGLLIEPEQVLIVAGVQESLNLLARLFLSPGDTALIEEPGYLGAARCFAAAGARVRGVPVDEDGLMTAALPEGRASLLYATPSHQYPSGHVLSLSRRHALIAWARRSGCYVLEDDYDNDFQYEGSSLPAMSSLAPDCCIYLGTFSKSLGAGLRLGYLVVPSCLIESVRDAKALLNNGSAWLNQAALAEFIRSGSYASHVTRCTAYYKDSRDAMVAALARHFGDVRLSGEGSGLHLFWQLPAGVPEAARLEDLARQAGVGIYSLTSAGVHCVGGSDGWARRGVLLGYATLLPKQIEQAIARLSDVVDDTLDCQPGFAEVLMRHEPPPRRAVFPSERRPPRVAPKIVQQPALRTISVRRIQSAHSHHEEDRSTMRPLAGVYRYPVKGLSAQALRGVELTAGKPFPFDRIFALARPDVPIDVMRPTWRKKGLFVMLMLDEALAQVRTRLDVNSLQFDITRGDKVELTADLSTDSGREAVERYVQALVPRLSAPPRLVRSQDGHFMDKPDNVLSLINLATVRSLESKWGHAIDPLRFRANFYIEGLRPWEEFDWIGSDVQIGDALLRVDRRNGRCSATNVNPATGQRDLDIPGSLRREFGHKDLGVYLIVRKGGKVVLGDPVIVPQFDVPTGEQTVSMSAPSSPVPAAARSYICRGCYFIYEEAKGLPHETIAPGTPFADIPAQWRCPDCGTEKSTFRPYAHEPLRISG